MGEPANPFNWNLFFGRMSGGMTIVVIWAVRDGLKHDSAGVSVALLTGIMMATICYFWVRSDSNRVEADKKPGSHF